MSNFATTKAQQELHLKISKNLSLVTDWFCQKRNGYAFPFYTSTDVRSADFKLAVVDANIYPAGFNNICPTDREFAGGPIDTYLTAHYGKKVNKIALLCEEHTNNLFYWDNVYSLKEIIESTGREVRLTIPKTIERPINLTTASGAQVVIYPFIKNENKNYVGDQSFEPELVISNNDFSDSQETWASGLTVPVNPPRELGWYRRKKSTHFKYYNELAKELALLIDVDPWIMQVNTDVLFDCDLSFPENRDRAAQKAQQMLDQLKEDYRVRGIKEEPVLFIKNNSGTYGLAVAQVKSGEEILSWNSKARTKMKAAKGGSGVTELLFQEGIPTSLTVDGHTCEPVIYLVGCDLIGGFLRAHSEKGKSESLNSPGAVYKRLCVSDLKISVEGNPMENVFGMAARISSLAIGREAKDMDVIYTNFNVDGTLCCSKQSLKS